MILEFRPYKDFNFITTFAKKFHIPSTETCLVIPRELGEGSIRKIDLSQELIILIHQYRLNEDLILKRLAPENKIDRVTMLFYRSMFPGDTYFSTTQKAVFQGPRLNHSTIEISSNDLNSIVKFPADSNIHFTVVGISSRLLHIYFHNVQENNIVKNVIDGIHHSFLYHERMWPQIEKVLEHLTLINLNEPLAKFYFKLKVEELLYHLFDKLLKREGIPQKHINNEDVIKMHAIKNEIVKDFAKPPVLSELASLYSFSQTKMKSLFKQIYGDTIFNHFQKARMDEAAFLLRNSNMTVSQIGYRLGFSNLSHFSRLFAKHYQQSPKKFSITGHD